MLISIKKKKLWQPPANIQTIVFFYDCHRLTFNHTIIFRRPLPNQPLIFVLPVIGNVLPLIFDKLADLHSILSCDLCRPNLLSLFSNKLHRPTSLHQSIVFGYHCWLNSDNQWRPTFWYCFSTASTCNHFRWPPLSTSI